MTPDGKRFIHLVPATQAEATQGQPAQAEIRVVMNWLEELKAKVPLQ